MSKTKGKEPQAMRDRIAGGQGLASGLQPGGTAPGAQVGATQGSIGTGGADANKDTGNLGKRERRFPDDEAGTGESSAGREGSA